MTQTLLVNDANAQRESWEHYERIQITLENKKRTNLILIRFYFLKLN